MKITDKLLLNYISENLKRIRIEKGYSNYEYFAYEIGISRSQYGRYETGENMKVLTLLKILNFHNISFTEFFKGLDEY